MEEGETGRRRREKERGAGGEKGGSQFRAGFHMEDCANFF